MTTDPGDVQAAREAVIEQLYAHAGGLIGATQVVRAVERLISAELQTVLAQPKELEADRWLSPWC